MTEATLSHISRLLSEAFFDVRQEIRSNMPNIAVDSGHYCNDAFAFRAYAEFTNDRRVVVISFNIQLSTTQIKIWGDIARENGFVVKDVTQTTLDSMSSDSQVVDVAQRFASMCKEETALICQELI